MRSILLVGAIAAATSTPSFAGDTPVSKVGVSDPNEKVCEQMTVVGSRLAKKRVCATRAEWEAKRREDRTATEKVQTQLCVNNPISGKC